MSSSSRKEYEASEMTSAASSGSSSQPHCIDEPEAAAIITDADRTLPQDLMDHIVFGYMNSTPLYGRSLFANLSKSYAAQAKLAAFYLVNGDKENADELVDENPAILSCIVETTDRYGHRTKAGLFELAAMYGSFNIHRTELPCQKDFGLVERWIRYLPLEEAIERLKALNLSWDKKRMQVAKTAITDFITAIKNAKSPYDDVLKVELAESIKKFKQVFTPDPNVVITTGYIFDLQVLKLSLDLLKKHIADLGGWRNEEWNDKSHLFAMVGFGFLQDCSSILDKQVFISSTYHAVKQEKGRDYVNMITGWPNYLQSWGSNFCLDVLGDNCTNCLALAPSDVKGPNAEYRWPVILQGYMQAKTSALQCVMQQTNDDAAKKRCCVIM